MSAIGNTPAPANAQGRQTARQERMSQRIGFKRLRFDIHPGHAPCSLTTSMPPFARRPEGAPCVAVVKEGPSTKRRSLTCWEPFF